MFKVGILGCGNIASHMASEINELDNVELYAVASRSQDKADKFAEKWNATKAYDSYDKLAADEQVDLIYVATPHTFHYEHTMLCLKAGRNVLVEKPFAINRTQADEMVQYAREHNLFLQEAMWTRFVPHRMEIADYINSNKLGKLCNVEAEFCLNLTGVPRLTQLDLGGGALLDLGIYCLTSADMFLDGSSVTSKETECFKYETSVDGTDYIRFTNESGQKALLKTSMMQGEANYAFLYFEKGYIYINGINNLDSYTVFDNKGQVLYASQSLEGKGYKYEVLASQKAIAEDKNCCDEMTSQDTLRLMEWMDELRQCWSVKYPME